jgi:hypothetical protein
MINNQIENRLTSIKSKKMKDLVDSGVEAEQSQTSFATAKERLDKVHDMNYERQFFEKNLEETDLEKTFVDNEEKLFQFGNDYYSYAVFAFYIFDENERRIVDAGPLNRDRMNRQAENYQNRQNDEQ